jgi:AraC family transcriptional regulator
MSFLKDVSEMDSRRISIMLPPMSQLRLLDSRERSDLIRVILQSDGPGIVESAGLESASVAIHVGRPARLECRHGDQTHVGLAIHGDVDVLPPGQKLRWEMKETHTALLLRVRQELLRKAADECGVDAADIQIRSRFQIREPQIEHIGWALMAEVEEGYPNGRPYMDGLANALAVLLLRKHSSLSRDDSAFKSTSRRKKLERLLAFIEAHLQQDLSLERIAEEAGLSVSHVKALFRKSMGTPLHQYIIRRRVERAAVLLKESHLPIGEIAVESGFSHQSHLAMHMRRTFGVSPKEFRSADDSSLDNARHPLRVDVGTAAGRQAEP